MCRSRGKPLRLDVGRVETDIADQAGKMLLLALGELLIHPAPSGIGQERVHLAKPNTY